MYKLTSFPLEVILLLFDPELCLVACSYTTLGDLALYPASGCTATKESSTYDDNIYLS